MLTVEADPARVEIRLSAGELICPDCAGLLCRWGWARSRVLRDATGGLMAVRPRRTRCVSCGVSHVLLPVFALVRRADMAEVIGAALAAKATGAGVRVIAERLGRPVETVRGWLRRFAARAETVRRFFTVLLVDAGVDPAPPGTARTVFADAVAAVVGAWWSMTSRWPAVGTVSPWLAACAVTGGILLAPAWPAKKINKSRP
ncbi:helix-turn-helix domain-containing protein [Streptomyces sp. NPDC102274]|uniref:helix-turn-helix domain-containing protein n=1 Tax=Streptomyces sp. NPDC102274 TaxID=3366151 RepID=UPI003812B063